MENPSINLIFECENIPIPSNFRYINDVNPIIYELLTTTKQYKVQSKVRRDVLISFINHWIYNQTPDINPDNISEYILLSEEFDRMRDIIELYSMQTEKTKKSLIISRNTELKKKIDNKKSESTKKKDHYHYILKNLIINNGIDIKPNINELKRRLFHICVKDYYKIIPFLLHDQIEVNGLQFILNEEDKEAYLYGINSLEIVFLPRSIKYKSQEYLITKMIKMPRFFYFEKPKSFICSSNSELKVLEFSSILSECTKIGIPSCLIIPNGLESTSGKIEILPSKQENIKFYDNDHHIIISKTDPKSDEFDLLVHIDQTIEKFTIPSFIKKIDKYAFSSADNIESIIFPKDSQINTIETHVFDHCNLKEIVIPPHVKIIRKKAFINSKIEIIKFTSDSKLEIIEENAFYASSLESLTLPSSVKLKDYWCYCTPNLYEVKILKNNIQNISMYNDKIIIGKSDSKSDIFDVIVFACRDIECIKIPSFIKRIDSCAFSPCHYLYQVDFEENSQLEFIGDYAFEYTKMKKISIPANVYSIGKYCFNDCGLLNEIIFSDDSELLSIENNNISHSIQYFTIPNKVTKINKEWLINSDLLKNVFVNPKNKNFVSYSNEFILGKSRIENETFDVLLFANRNITKIKIPPFIKIIGSHCFYKCEKLCYVQFSNDSQLNIIDDYAFANSGLKSIIIPDSVNKIGDYAFNNCLCLTNAVLTRNSKLYYIGNNAFANSLIRSFYVPPKVIIIDSFAFYECKNLKAFEIDEKSNMVSIYHSVLGFSSAAIYMNEKLEKKLNLKFIDNDNDYTENYLLEVLYGL